MQIGAGGGQGRAQLAADLADQGMVWHAHGHSRAAGGHRIGDNWRSLQHEAQPSWPESRGKLPGHRGYFDADGFQLAGIWQEKGYRQMGRALFDAVEEGNRLFQEGVGADPIDGVGGKGHWISPAQVLYRPEQSDGLLCGDSVGFSHVHPFSKTIPAMKQVRALQRSAAGAVVIVHAIRPWVNLLN
jgi:hypothetical protein